MPVNPAFFIYKNTFMKKHLTEQLEKFAHELKENGFTVFVDRKHPFYWLYFMKDNKFGDVQQHPLDHGFNFGSVHFPCERWGTGLRTATNVLLNISHAYDAINKAGWNTYLEGLKSYKTVEDFLKQKEREKFGEYYIL